MVLGTPNGSAAVAPYVATIERDGQTAGATRRAGLREATVFIAVLLVSAVTGSVWLHEYLESPSPEVRPIDPYKPLFDLTPVTVTVTAADQRVEWRTSVHEVRMDWTLWRRMHLADWNNVTETLRQEGLGNMGEITVLVTVAIGVRALLLIGRERSR